MHQENACVNVDHVYIHEHDLRPDHLHTVNDKHFLICSTCDISYCENCGKEVSIWRGDFDVVRASLQ
jgi:hypothetical protein